MSLTEYKKRICNELAVFLSSKQYRIDYVYHIALCSAVSHVGHAVQYDR